MTTFEAHTSPFEARNGLLLVPMLLVPVSVSAGQPAAESGDVVVERRGEWRRRQLAEALPMGGSALDVLSRARPIVAFIRPAGGLEAAAVAIRSSFNRRTAQSQLLLTPSASRGFLHQQPMWV